MWEGRTIEKEIKHLSDFEWNGSQLKETLEMQALRFLMQADTN
jgi:hypothetical protein